MRIVLKYLASLFFILSLSAKSFAYTENKENEFERVYNSMVQSYLGGDNKDSLLGLLEDLVNSTHDPIEKAKTYLLIALVQEENKAFEEMFKNAYLAIQFALQSEDGELKMRSFGYLSNQYLNFGLYSQGWKYIGKVEKINQKEKIPSISLFTHQNKAFYYLQLHNYDSFFSEINRAEKYVHTLKDTLDRKMNNAINMQLQAIAWMKKGQIENARPLFEKAKKLIGDEGTAYTANIQLSLARYFFDIQEYDSSYYYLKTLKNNLAYNYNIFLEIEWMDLMQKYYLQIGNSDSAAYYEKMYLKMQVDKLSFIKQISDTILNINNQNVLSKDKKSNWLFYILLSVLILTLNILIYLYFKGKKIERKYEEIIQNIEEKRIKLLKEVDDNLNTNKSNKGNIGDSSKENESKGFVISEKTKEQILKDLIAFENSKRFLRKSISLSELSSNLQVNSKYLSHVINSEKNKDFNSYINDLRINYILRKIITDEKYLEYKIAYLAEECGFTSHSRFSLVFKQVTGMSPSHFISRRKKELKNKNN